MLGVGQAVRWLVNWLRERLAGDELRELQRRRVVHEEFRLAMTEHPDIAHVLDEMQQQYFAGPRGRHAGMAPRASAWTIGPAESTTSPSHEAEHRLRPPPD